LDSRPASKHYINSFSAQRQSDESNNYAPLPIALDFGAEDLHSYEATGNWDINRAIEEHKGIIVRSIRAFCERSNKEEDNLENVIFKFGSRSFISGDAQTVRGYSSTYDGVKSLVHDFIMEYAQPKKPEGGSFFLIKTEGNDISRQRVSLEVETLLSNDDLDRQYPDGSRVWHEIFEEKLRLKKQGLSIFEGQPGTGKTSYLRHLMGRLNDTHQFYFIPPSSMGVLSKPSFIGFWANERRCYPDKKLSVILEDADGVLMTRGSDNRDEVSALLNLSDGMLGDFLSLQIICTINCRITDIDQALLRPGRLICHRKFERLSAKEAARLAAHLGKSLPQKEDYSLAEVFSEEAQANVSQARMGFGG